MGAQSGEAVGGHGVRRMFLGSHRPTRVHGRKFVPFKILWSFAPVPPMRAALLLACATAVLAQNHWECDSAEFLGTLPPS